MSASNSSKLEDFLKYARQRPSTYLLFSICFEILYWLFLLLVIFTTIAGPLWYPILINPILILLYFALAALLGRLRKRFRVNALEALKNETRLPILYLRSFFLESVDKSQKGLLDREINFYEKEHDDEVLALVLKDIGPMIAVGNPSDKLPPLGSIRLYFKDEEWQEQVNKLMAVSQFIIIQPGYTEGTEWEMQAVKNLPPEKVIYSFLAWQHLNMQARQIEFEIFAMQFRRIYGRDLPANLGDAYFLYFDKDWNPRVAELGVWKELIFLICSSPHLIWLLYSKAIYSFELVPRVLRRLPVPKMLRKYSVPKVRESLRPLFKERGIHLSVWRTVAYFLAIIAIVSSLIYVNSYLNIPPPNNSFNRSSR